MRTNDTQTTEVWFVIYAQEDLDLCQQLLDSEEGLAAVSETRSTVQP